MSARAAAAPAEALCAGAGAGAAHNAQRRSIVVTVLLILSASAIAAAPALSISLSGARQDRRRCCVVGESRPAVGSLWVLRRDVRSVLVRLPRLRLHGGAAGHAVWCVCVCVCTCMWSCVAWCGPMRCAQRFMCVVDIRCRSVLQ